MSSSYDSALRRRGRLWKLLLLGLAVVVCAVVGFVVGERLMSLRNAGSSGAQSASAPDSPQQTPRRVSTEEMVARRLDAVAIDEARRRLGAGVPASSGLSRWSSRPSAVGAAPAGEPAPAGVLGATPGSAGTPAAPRLDAPRDRARRDARTGGSDRFGLRPPPRWVDEPSAPPRRLMPVLDLEVVDPYPPAPDGDATGPFDERPE